MCANDGSAWHRKCAREFIACEPWNGEALTLGAIGERLGLSGEGVRLIIERAMAKVRAGLGEGRVAA